MGRTIYNLYQSYCDARHQRAEYYDPDGWYATDEGWEKYQGNVFVAAGDPGHGPEQWFVPDLYLPRKQKPAIKSFDYYECSTFGVFSPRAISALQSCFGGRFDTLPGTLEGHQYFFPRCLVRVDCLDRESSKIFYADDSARTILNVKKHVFRDSKIPADPVIFAIPEMAFALYCTESIPAIVEKAGLKGFKFCKVR